MTDIVERLRDKHCCDSENCNCDEAADEITRQRTTVLDLLGQVGQLSDEIARLRAENEILAGKVGKLEAECFSLAAWQCVYTDGKTGLVCDEHGNQYCAMTKEADRLRAQNAELVAALEWIVGTTPVEPELMAEKARAALAKVEEGRE